MALKWFGSDTYAMKTIRLLSLIGAALVGLGPAVWAGPRGGGGGFTGGGHFGGSHFGGYSGAPRAPQQFYYYSGARTSAVTPHASAKQMPNGSISSNAGRLAAVDRHANRVNSAVGQKRALDSRLSTAANRQSFMKNHAFARHDADWHRDWDRRRAHFHHGHVFIFIDGFWWGLYPWDYYPYDDGYYPYDDNSYPYDYYPYNYDDQSGDVVSDQYGTNSAVSAVQSALAKLGYYHAAIDGIEGDDTQAALARYQEDHDLSVTGTLTAATLQSLGLKPTAS